MIRDTVLYTADVVQHCIDQSRGPEPPKSPTDMRGLRLYATRQVALSRLHPKPSYSADATVTSAITRITQVGVIADFDEMLYRHCKSADRDLAKKLLDRAKNEQEELVLAKALLGVRRIR